MTAPQKLQDWITDTGRKKWWVVDQLGITGTTLTRWLGGELRPDADNRIRLERLTDGAVKATDWVAE